MQTILFKLTLFCVLLTMGLLAKAQIKTVDFDTVLISAKTTNPVVFKDNFRLELSQLIGRKPASTYQQELHGSFKLSHNGYLASDTVKRKVVSSDSLIRSTTYHLIPLLKEKGSVQNTTSNRWSSPEKNGGHDEKR